jgi:hypothetical protein
VRTDAVAESIDSNMHTFKPHLTSYYVGIRLGDLHLAFTKTLDFASVQHNASLNDINDCVVVSRLAIAGDDFWTLFFHIVL